MAPSDSPDPKSGKLPDDEGLDAVLAELPESGATVVLKRRNDQRPSIWDYLGRMPAEEFSMEGVKTEFGGGVYRIRLVDKRNKYIPGGSYEFSIDARFKPVGGVLSPAPAFPAPSPAPSELGEIKDLLRTVAGLLMAREAHAAAPPVPLRDPLDVALKMAELMMRNQPAQLPMDQLVGVFKQGLELASSIQPPAPPAPPADPLSGMVVAATPLFTAIGKRIEADAVARMTRAAPLNGSPHREIPMLTNGAANGAATAVPSVPAPSNSETILRTWHDDVRPYLSHLVELAKANKDPSLYADVILDQLPDTTYAAIKAEAQDLTWPDRTVAMFPEVASHAGWFRALLEHLREAVLEPDAGGSVAEDIR